MVPHLNGDMQTSDAGSKSALVSARLALRERVSGPTWIGLFLSLFAMLVARQAISYFSPTLTFTAALWKESLIWVSAAALLVVIRRGERLPLTSVGIGTSTWWKSILWGVLLASICAVVGGVLALVTGYGHGPGSAAFEKLPLWLITLIVFRAGVVEEFFYRGYAIERLQALGLGRIWAAAIPLVIFSVGHWTGGWANIVIALALGGVLTGFYFWRRDLIANMIGHGLVDFIANVLPKLFS
jgi:membrane protease YdiL (CAAX protease family)